MIITTAGEAKADAKAFYSYLSGPEAQAILKKFGFVTAQ
jgi:ABC-type molybdate transport system substrate-binding protein